MTSEREQRKARMAAAAQSRSLPEAPPLGKTAIRTKPVRVTLNMPPELFRQLTHWADSAADLLDVPRVSVQDALRAMVWAGVADGSPASPVLAELLRGR
jgi:hypothetical protein